MSITIELEPETEARLRQLAARAGEYPETLVKQWVLAHVAAVPTVSNNLASVYGKWPDAPSDAELNEELAYLAGQKTTSLPSLK